MEYWVFVAFVSRTSETEVLKVEIEAIQKRGGVPLDRSTKGVAKRKDEGRVKKQPVSQAVSYLLLAEWINFLVETEFSGQTTLAEVIRTLSQKQGIAFTYE